MQEYDSVIKEQLASGVIERVVELERPDRVYDIPHLAVVRKGAPTMKFREEYDASAKSGMEGASLNNCLHKGLSVTPFLFHLLIRNE